MAPWGKASLAFLAGVVGALGVRKARDGNSQTKHIAGIPEYDPFDTKLIAGVPLHNYRDDLTFGKGIRYVVVVTPGTSNEKIHELCTMMKCVKEGHPDQGGVPYFMVWGSEVQLQKVLESSNGVVKFAEPDSAVYNPDSHGGVSQEMWGLDRVGAPLRQQDGEGVNVYVLDTGVRATHTDFGGRVIPTLDMTCKSWLCRRECHGAKRCAPDRKGYGTAFAGATAGATLGVAPKATVRSVKVLSEEGRWSWIYEALDWLATKASFPAVASMPFGGTRSHQHVLRTAVDTAVDAGVVVVVAAGNRGQQSCQRALASIPSAIRVGSTDSNDARSEGSDYGICIDIWAPGTNIATAYNLNDDGKVYWTGTGMASSLVSGAAALVLQANPELKSPAVLNALLGNAINNSISGLTAGDRNSLLYVGAGGPPPTPVPAPIPSSICPAHMSEAFTSIVGETLCDCFPGTKCYEDGVFGCTRSDGSKSFRVHRPSCSTCECK